MILKETEQFHEEARTEVAGKCTVEFAIDCPQFIFGIAYDSVRALRWLQKWTMFCRKELIEESIAE
jgi:hypothetical protein